VRVGVAAFGSRLGSWGGLNVYTRSLVEALAQYGTSHTFVVLVSDRAADFWTDREWPANIRFEKILDHAPAATILVRGWRYARRRLGLRLTPDQGEDYVARRIEHLRLDLLHYPETLIYPLSVGTPCVLTVFDLQQEYYPQFFTASELAWRQKTYRASVDKAARLIVPTLFTSRTLAEKYQTPKDKVKHIPVGIGASFTRVTPDEVARVRGRYRLPERFLYYPANPWPHKNHARLMAALRIYRARHEDCPWLVLSGRLRHERRDTISLAVAAGVADRVIDLDFVPQQDLPALYSAATLMVFPSLFEGFGIPLIEAMACGCPVVAADATTIPEVTNGAALLFDPLDPEAMARAIHTGLNEPQLTADLVKRGRQQIGRFDWQRIVADTIRVYEEAVGADLRAALSTASRGHAGAEAQTRTS
jgi:glycosyltransferase involved in cell wall biosynthesis